ncbi:LANO_0E05864g1_1 [Lachancea nothofagi CBS 11611]|uniref:LANO_0E05864g1_1 n=1 Tax=Lachancea nothofagi CBS 11611 TaxID=1266666 RepID=A0A1G4JTD2_9SACH|nr:LANO_0E05864g1_1 [Lachancea nothofagi CBS 11611]
MGIIDKFRKRTCTANAVYPRSSKLSTLDPTRDKLKVVYDVYEPRTTRPGDSVVNFVFLHGSGMNRKIWDYYLDKLAEPGKGWKIGKIILLDQVNHGDSAVLNERLLGTIYDWSDGARDVCKVCVDELFTDEPHNTFNIVVGHSMGGFQALCCSIMHPGLFQLVLCIEPVVLMKRVRASNNEDITIITPAFHDALATKMTDKFDSPEQFSEYIDGESIYTATIPVIRKDVKKFEIREIAEGVLKTKISSHQHMLTYLCLNPTATWLMKSLPFIACPVVCLYGEKSKWCPPENRIYLREHIRNYWETEVADGGHLVNIEDPDAVLQKLNSVVSKRLANAISEEQPVLDDQTRKHKFDACYKQLLSSRVIRGTPKL